MRFRTGLLIAMLFHSSAAIAQSAAVVEGLQQPVWLERNKQRSSLRPGQALLSGDKIKTGNTGKLVIGLNEGSQVKLGINVELNVRDLQKPKTVSDTFVGFFRVLTGAFRFTTLKSEQLRKRNVEINLTTATIGIRGTDVWGRTGQEKDFVVLLEGKIDITRHNNNKVVSMDKPLSVYEAESKQIAQPLQTIEMDIVQRLALETELDQGKGVIADDGQYIVYLQSSSNKQTAIDNTEVFEKAGYAVKLYETELNDQKWYRVGVPGFVSHQDANWFVNHVKLALDINDAWISKVK